MWTMTTLPARTAFLIGMALSLLPTFGPFSAALLLAARSWLPRRRDLLWGVAAALFGVAGTVTGGLSGGALSLATVAGPWIVYRAFAELKQLELAHARRGALARGLLAGFVLAVAFGLIRSVSSLDLLAARTLPDAIVWRGSPATFGHSVLVLGGLIALLAREHRGVARGAMGVALFGILVSGSLEAAIAWLGLAVATIALGPGVPRRSRAVEAAALAAAIVVAGLVAPLLGWSRLGFLLPPDTGPAAARNLFAGTEVPAGGWWDDRWVDVTTSTVTLDGRELTAYEVDRHGEAGWQRLQQVVRLTPGTRYTLSAWIDASAEGVPGLQGWGERRDRQEAPLVLVASLRDGALSAHVDGPGRLVDARVVASDDAWRRVAVTFAVAAGGDPLAWFVGFAPDARDGPGAAGRVAGLMLEQGTNVGPYRAGPATSALSFGYARAPLWQAAWDGIRARPWFGHGRDAFGAWYQRSSPGIERQEIVPAHPHNLALLVLFEQGVLGLAALGLLLVALFGEAVRLRDLGLLAVAAAALFVNLFDATLVAGAVVYPLAAVAGWRSTMQRPLRAEGTQGVRQVAVRVTLAATDLGVAFLALLAAQGVAQRVGAPFELSPPLLYALIAWPMTAWREGLYPGYGLTPAQELRRQTTAWAYAATAFTVGTLLFPATLAIGASGLLALLPLALVGAPLGRAATKRLLHGMRVWGRPVVILGAGTTGQRVARALTRTPLDGLHPIGFFDDDPAKRRRRIAGVRVRGTSDEMAAFAQRHDVRHAIVATDALPQERRDQLATGGERVFRRVQFVPKLQGLPSEDVLAADLDGMLALEVKSGLASPGNRMAKRTFDVVAVILGGVVISPLLAALAIAVYLDSPGPVFFGHTRIGRGGRRITTWKFRSMVPDAEAVLRRHLAENPSLRAEWERDQKLRDDPRVTRVGRFLRATSLDELPQIWNVVTGEMSLVGPRPIVDDEVPKYGHVFALYRMVRPGITGLWQVSGRSDTGYETRVAMDAHYVRNWSVWLDLVILAKTVGVVVRRDGAY